MTIIRTVGWIWILESFATDASTFFTTLFVQLIHFKNIRPNFYKLCSLISLPLVCENLKSYQSSPWLDQYIINTMLLNKYDNLPVRSLIRVKRILSETGPERRWVLIDTACACSHACYFWGNVISSGKGVKQLKENLWLWLQGTKLLFP